VLPASCKALIDSKAWEIPPIFRILQEGGGVSDEEMFRTFNCGIGMVIVVPEKEADDILIRLSGLSETAFMIGEVAKCAIGAECVEFTE
jgi:phosphoribosylformylglycinamidine cyclo-ligase